MTDPTTTFFECSACREVGTADDFIDESAHGRASCPKCGTSSPRLSEISRERWLLGSIAAMLRNIPGSTLPSWSSEIVLNIDSLLREEGYLR